jgi:carboxyl-terminal processing protease
MALPLYVLVDGHTASAAEVLAVALQDRNRATIIGSTSFGKGSVQNVGPLPHGGELAVTWARLFGPSGYSYHHQGVHPDLCLSRPGATPASAASGVNLWQRARPPAGAAETGHA